MAEAIDAELYNGQFICLVGRNGSGKSTLLRTLAVLQPFLDGSIQLNNKDIQQYSAEELSKHIGIVLTHPLNLQHTTVRQLVAYGRLPYTGFLGRLKDEDYKVADFAIEAVGISNLKDRNISTLSDGERQKAMIAKSIAQGTELLLLDEPSAFLDYPSKSGLMDLLKKLSKEFGKCIILSTHDIQLATAYADCIWHIKGKRLHQYKNCDFSLSDL